MTVYIGQASCDENGRYVGGRAGNQSGTELNIRTFYNKPWDRGLIRFKDGAKAQKCATAMIQAVGNMHIGYDQYERNSLLALARAAGWNLSKVTTDCETDCSALAGVCGIAAGAPESVIYQGGNLCYTGNIIERFKATGLVDIYDSSYAANSANLQNGDILVSSTHAVVVTTGGKVPSGASSTSSSTGSITESMSIEDIARAIWAGRITATGEERKALLGDKWQAVQDKIQELYYGGKPATTTSTSTSSNSTIQSGTYRVMVNGLRVRSAPNLKDSSICRDANGNEIHYDCGEIINSVKPNIVSADGWWWASYTAYSGATRYVAMSSTDGSKKYLAKI